MNWWRLSSINSRYHKYHQGSCNSSLQSILNILVKLDHFRTKTRNLWNDHLQVDSHLPICSKASRSNLKRDATVSWSKLRQPHPDTWSDGYQKSQMLHGMGIFTNNFPLESFAIFHRSWFGKKNHTFGRIWELFRKLVKTPIKISRQLQQLVQKKNGRKFLAHNNWITVCRCVWLQTPKLVGGFNPFEKY